MREIANKDDGLRALHQVCPLSSYRPLSLGFVLTGFGHSQDVVILSPCLLTDLGQRLRREPISDGCSSTWSYVWASHLLESVT